MLQILLSVAISEFVTQFVLHERAVQNGINHFHNFTSQYEVNLLILPNVYL
jgi:hypothetical protein